MARTFSIYQKAYGLYGTTPPPPPAFAGAHIAFGINSVVQDWSNNLRWNAGTLTQASNTAGLGGDSGTDRLLLQALKATDSRFEYNGQGVYGKKWQEQDPTIAGTPHDHFVSDFVNPAANSAYARRVVVFSEWINQFNADYAAGLSNQAAADKQVQFVKNYVNYALANGFTDVLLVTPTDIADPDVPAHATAYRATMDLAVAALKATYPAAMFIDAWADAYVGKNATAGPWASVIFRDQERPIYHEYIPGNHITASLVYEKLASLLNLTPLADLTAVTASSTGSTVTVGGNSLLKLEYALFQGTTLVRSWQPVGTFSGLADGQYTPKARLYTRPAVVVSGAPLAVAAGGSAYDPATQAYLAGLPADAVVTNPQALDAFVVYLRGKNWLDKVLCLWHPDFGHSPVASGTSGSILTSYSPLSRAADGQRRPNQASASVQAGADGGKDVFVDPNFEALFSPVSGPATWLTRVLCAFSDNYHGFGYVGPQLDVTGSSPQISIYQRNAYLSYKTDAAAVDFAANTYTNVAVELGAGGDTMKVGSQTTTGAGTASIGQVLVGQCANTLAWGQGSAMRYSLVLAVTTTDTEKSELAGLLA